MAENHNTPGSENEQNTPFPVWFLAHGSPMLAIQDTAYTRTLAALASELRMPTAIVAVSAHWQTPTGVRVTAAERPETIHDFGGFDPYLYQITYPAPGAPALASEIVALLTRAGFDAAPDPGRGLDHGTWVPLRWSFREATVPVVQFSLPVPATPAELLRFGQALAPLRHQGVLVLGSGGIVHNLRTVRLDLDEAPVPRWASDFDGWVRDRLAKMDLEALAGYQDRAPHAELAVPTPEHFQPLLVALGAAGSGDRVTTLFEGFQHGTLSLRSISLENP